MSRLSPRLARRIDRLARRAHRFHRFAHHPLCGAYAGEVIRVGRASPSATRLCRGCAACALGLATGLGAGALWAPLASKAVAILAALAIPLAIALFTRRRPFVRPTSKNLTRALPGALLAGTLAAGLRAGGVAGLGAAALALVATGAAALAYRRRAPDRSPCDGCPERILPVVCSGHRTAAHRERAFARLAGRWMSAEGP